MQALLQQSADGRSGRAEPRVEQGRTFPVARSAGGCGSLLAAVLRRRDFCAQGFSRNLHVREGNGISDYAVYEWNPDQRTDRRLPAGISAIRDRDYSLRAKQEDV